MTGSAPLAPMASQDVAIVGVAACLPVAPSASHAWASLLRGEDLLGSVDSLPLSENGCLISLLNAARQALSTAPNGEVLGVVLGVPVGSPSLAAPLAEALAAEGFRCDLAGDASSAFAALSVAQQQLDTCNADLMLCGAAAPDGRVVLFSLARLQDAEQSAEPPYALLRGIGSAGRSAPSDAIQRAYANDEQGPETVELLDLNGSPQDMATLSATFAKAAPLRHGPREAWVSMTETAAPHDPIAGALQIFKATLAIAHRGLPAHSSQAEQPLLPEPLYATQHTRPWITPPDGPRRAAVACWGSLGNSYHLVLEDYQPSPDLAEPEALADEQPDLDVLAPPPAPLRSESRPADLLALSAATPEALQRHVLALLDRLSAADAQDWLWRHLCRDSRQAFSAALPCRLLCIADSAHSLRDQLGAANQHIAEAPQHAFSTDGCLFYQPHGDVLDPESSVLLFPGFGTPPLELAAALALHHPAALAVWDEASPQVFEESADGPLTLRDVTFAPPGSLQSARLAQPYWALPSMVVGSLAALAVLESLGFKAGHVAGHGFGEVTAMAAAGAVPRTALEPIARSHGHVLADANAQAPGALAVVASDAETLAAALEVCEGGDDVGVALRNSPQQTVLSGPREAVCSVAEQLDVLGLTVELFSDSPALHSPLTMDAAEAFSEALQPLVLQLPDETSCLIWSAERGDYYDESYDIAACLGRQTALPLDFAALIQAQYDAGIRVFVDVGPGDALARFVRETLGDRPHTSIALDSATGDGWHAFLTGVARLVLAGADLTLGALDAGYAALPTATAGDFYQAAPEPELEPEVEPAPEQPEEIPAEDAEAPDDVPPEPAPIADVEPPAPLVALEAPSADIPAETLESLSPTAAAAYRTYRQTVIEAHQLWQDRALQAHMALLATLDRGLELALAAPPDAEAPEALPDAEPPVEDLEQAPPQPQEALADEASGPF